MATTQARIALATSFVVMALVGGGLIFSRWYGQNNGVAIFRSGIFVFILACIHIAGYVAYVRQEYPQPEATASRQDAIRFSPSYGPALRFGILVQATLGILTALMLDGENHSTSLRSLSWGIGLVFFVSWRVVRSPRQKAISSSSVGEPRY